jgi:hypothetical protein
MVSYGELNVFFVNYEKESSFPTYLNNLGWDNAKKFKFSKQESKCC